jgi:hypothetical protein
MIPKDQSYKVSEQAILRKVVSFIESPSLHASYILSWEETLNYLGDDSQALSLINQGIEIHCLKEMSSVFVNSQLPSSPEDFFDSSKTTIFNLASPFDKLQKLLSLYIAFQRFVLPKKITDLTEENYIPVSYELYQNLRSAISS